MTLYFAPDGAFVRAKDVLPENYRERTNDIAEYPAEATIVTLCGRGKDEMRGWELLPDLKRVETVFVYQPLEKHLAWIGRMPGLRRLGILNPKAADFTALGPLKQLEALFIEDATQLASLEFLSTLKGLRALGIFDAKRLADLSGLESVPRLQELALLCGIWNPLKVRTLQPIAALKSLTCLRLTADAQDGSLEPLRGLSKLEELDVNLLQPFEQVAKLSAYFPNTLCKYFAEPYETFTNQRCRKDPSHTGIHVLKGRRDFCRDCHPQKLADYLAEFERIRAQAKRSGSW
jgi:hypothetical protein